jgi:cytochrome c oxidase assembly protein subunit 15
MTRLPETAASEKPVRTGEPRGLHLYACFVALATWLLIMAGGMVTSTGSGLAVPDWPTTYGYNMFTYPYSKWVGGIFYEHGHRLIASTVGMLTIGLWIWLWKRETRRWLCHLGTVALAAVIFQGILGGLTVRYLLPTPISVAHACLAQTFFCIVVSIAIFTSSRWKRAMRDHAVMGAPRWQTPHLGIALVAVVFGQLLLGAGMRHTESGLAVTDFPLAYGQVIPDLSDSALERYNDQRRFELLLPVVTAGQIRLHMAHRIGAVAVAIVAVVVCAAILRRHRGVSALRISAWLILALLVVQMAMGAWTVLSEKQPVIATAHVAIGAAILGISWAMTLWSYRTVGVARRQSLPAAAIVGAAG